MPPIRRAALGLAILTAGLIAQAGVEKATETDRPPLKQPLASIPTRLGDWVGHDEAVDPKIAEESQATEYLNRSYVDQRHPQRRLKLWMNYSSTGQNLRHSPEVCLPSGGWTKAEALTDVVWIPRTDGSAQPISLLGYMKGELVQNIGFWYYIFGEGGVERFVRSLPISSRSSHGRTTRGSGLTIEIFYPGESDLEPEALQEFASALLEALESVLPDDRAQYHVP